MPKRILLGNMGSLGDLHPFMGLALELQKQGAEVLLVSGEFYRDYVESFGIPSLLSGLNFKSLS